MAKQLMIYESAVPVSNGRHGKWSVDVGADFGFSRNVNSVPLAAVEFPAAAAEYVIIFAGTGDVVTPAVLLGVREEENLYLADDGGWKARYVPAFLRRYPFVFSSRDEGKTFTLCIDESYTGFNQDGRGQPLYDAKTEKPSQYTQNVLKFLQQYQVESQRTQAFCRKLKELNLLEPMRAQISLASGERIALGGFMAVDRARLKTLASDKVAELLKSDELELIFAHLQSMRNFAGMRERLSTAAPVTTVAKGAEPEPGEVRAAAPAQGG
ncbi:SapC family protein [Ramlibacter sp. USB13]|uniref:SapC family protein n=1 Tax=Ramlibacter cellulosilyticus TaxID=2764187 RepID=A0A923SF87_9BURK|nr:SapC family protein [Ramlibacter cellulosilyticus]MBC5783687.1 SapC family protein [Ramlibacter cellulosilyticus]